MLFIDSKDSVFCILCLQARDLQTTADEQYRQELAAQTKLVNLYKVCVSHLCHINIGYFIYHGCFLILVTVKPWQVG